jgi:uncharacterized protein
MNKKILDILIYPVKSLGAYHQEKSYASTQGLEYDRKWMLLDDEGHMLTQREIHHLCLFNTLIDENNILVRYKENSLKFGMDDLTNVKIKTKVWDDQAELTIANERVNHWFSNQLSKNVKIGYLEKENDRVHHSSYLSGPQAVSLADGYPYLILGTASIDFLRKKASQAISYDRFRPNIVIESEIPHEEDAYTEFQIGDAIFKNVKPCVRCMVPSINQNTAVISKEPLKTLSKYRKFGAKIDFGTLAICIKPGWISKSDTVQML